MFSFVGTAATGSGISGVEFSNTGTGTSIIVADNGASYLSFEHLSCDRPATLSSGVLFSGPAISLGATTQTPNITHCRIDDVQIVACSSQPGLLTGSVSDPFLIANSYFVCNGSLNGSGTIPNVQIGTATLPSVNLVFDNDSFGAVACGDVGKPNIQVIRGEDISFKSGYAEWGDTATPTAGYVLDIPSSAQVAKGIYFYGGFTFRRLGGTERAATVGIHTNLLGAEVRLEQTEWFSNGGGVAMTQLVQNDASLDITMRDTTLFSMTGITASDSIANGTQGMTGVTAFGITSQGTRLNTILASPAFAFPQVSSACSTGSASRSYLCADSVTGFTVQNSNNNGPDFVGNVLNFAVGGGAPVKKPHIIFVSGTLTSGTPSTSTITFTGTAAFTSLSTYSCVVNNNTAQANPLKVTYTSGTSATITGPNTVTDAWSGVCFGT
jgi:hypothetical protein